MFLCFIISAELNNVKFSAYRTSMKLRALQKKLCSKYVFFLLCHSTLWHIRFYGLTFWPAKTDIGNNFILPKNVLFIISNFKMFMYLLT